MVLVLLLGTASAGSLDDSKNRPVTKVINLLKDMTAQLEKEGEEDEAVYDKMVCWCESNDKEKTKAIADGEQQIADLSASIEDLTANSAKLTSEIATLETELGKNQAALAKATGIREKELAEFNEGEKDSMGSIASLKSAVTVLGKHNSAFLQNADSVLATTVSMLKKAMKSKKVELMPSQRRALESFVASPTAFLQQVPSGGSYAPQSGQIFGILSNMKESFEANLDQARKDEGAAISTYQGLKAAKDDEIAAGTDQIADKTQALATSDEKCASDKVNLKDTTNTLAADREFLANLKATCADLDAQMAERQKTRAMETEACSKALAVLSGDDAHDLFTKTFNFVQKSSVVSSRREKAAKVLEAAGQRLRNPKYALLATQVRLNAFKKVKESIEKMVNDLVKEKEDEIAFKDYCIDAMNTNEHNTALKNTAKDDLVARIDDLTNTVKTLGDEITALENSMAEMRKQMKRAGEDRELANKAFMETVADQRATQQLLGKALGILQGFYGAAALVQDKKAAQTPPVQFKTYKKQEGGVMGMIQQIITDAKAMEAEAIRGEADDQKAYENFVKDTNEAIDAATVEMTNTAEAKAKAEGENTEAKLDLDATEAELKQLGDEDFRLHSECDFVLKNFDVRQSSRDDEMEALKDSISILSGSSQ